ncbi:Lsr2 family protein [Aestuariimicrobium sp. p3-SID1156]|uniref:histone-like nucleoid-structuring protein Lsr2 n=1 Tax=Aestuariimicrobium sp. p3-SID1156 TaxID=2916038 RepID=UPI00223AA724|nr:Lsr2 family protein [Aestuariimicrobium sp. p3-SID1156]MCT1458602.1 Lsr2 family protein [Aestuariimicrobium sp. p3-SID1156]
MVQRSVVILEDDIDGGEAAETVQFALDGVAYEIDLNEENAAKLRDALQLWIGHARKGGNGRRRAAASRGTGRSRSQAADIRTWAREQGYEVSGRGRVPEEIRAAYAAAH